jgi:hypothetical protein
MRAMIRMRIIQANSRSRRRMPASTGMMNIRKSGTISFHVIFILLNCSGLPFLKQRAQISFPECTGPAVIVTVHAVAARQPELKEKDEQYIPDNPDETEPEQDIYPNTVVQERYRI